MKLSTARRDIPLALASIAVAALVALLAVLDHHRVGRRAHRADVDAWLCEHRGTHCNRLQPEELESRWEVRERSYEGVFAVASVALVSAAVSAFRSRTH